MKHKLLHRFTSFVLAVILVLTSSNRGYLENINYIIKKDVDINTEKKSNIKKLSKDNIIHNQSLINPKLNFKENYIINLNSVSNTTHKILNINESIQDIKNQAKLDLLNTNVYENYQTDEIYDILDLNLYMNKYTKEKIENKQLKISLEIKDETKSIIYSALDIYNESNIKTKLEKIVIQLEDGELEEYNLTIQNKLLNTLSEKNYIAQIKLYINEEDNNTQIPNQENLIVKKITQPFKYKKLNENIKQAKQDIKDSMELDLENIEVTDEYIFSLKGSYTSKNNLLQLKQYIGENGEYNLLIKNILEDEQGNEIILYKIFHNDIIAPGDMNYQIIDDYKNQEDKYVFNSYLKYPEKLNKGKYKLKTTFALAKIVYWGSSLINKEDIHSNYNIDYLSNNDIYIDMNETGIIPLYETKKEIYIDEFDNLKNQTITNLKNNLEFSYSDELKKEINKYK